MRDSISKEEQMFLASVEDRFRKASDTYTMTCTGFLDLRQRSLVEDLWRELGRGQKEIRLVFWGGYEDAERTIAAFVPDYEEEPDYGLVVVRAASPQKGRQLTHRDYLGSLTGLGLKRDMIGDILVGDHEAQIIILQEILDFLLLNYSKAGRSTLQLEPVGIGDLKVPQAQVKLIKDTVASLRLDNLIAAAFGLSRGKASEAIRGGLVYVNSRQIFKVDAPVEEGDKLVLRGKGKAFLRQVGNRTRKDRIFVEIERYI